MGYSTDFSGQFDLDRPLDDGTYALLCGLARTRRMKRQGLDPSYGTDGEFYFNPSSRDFGQEDEASVVDHNHPPCTQPGLWLKWVPTEDRLAIEWDGGEKFYNYVKWIEYLITAILKPRGFVLNGIVEWNGESHDDLGRIVITNNAVTTQRGHIAYGN